MELKGKFITWLRLHTDRPQERGEGVDIARATGLSEGYVSRLLKKERKGSLRVETLERVAKQIGCPVWELVWRVEHGLRDLPPGIKRG